MLKWLVGDGDEEVGQQYQAPPPRWRSPPLRPFHLADAVESWCSGENVTFSNADACKWRPRGFSLQLLAQCCLDSLQLSAQSLSSSVLSGSAHPFVY